MATTQTDITRGDELEARRREFDDFLEATEGARALSARCRDYRDNKQWTEEERAVLARRRQAPITVNRIAPKIDFIRGLEERSATDPQAYPRTRKHEASADAVTDALRFVADANEFDALSVDVLEFCAVEGYGGAVVDVEYVRGEYVVRLHDLSHDRVYFDPHSRKRDFSDCAYKGIVRWLDEDEAKREFPGKAREISQAFETVTDETDGTTFEDKPRWIDRVRRRIRVCRHYYRKGGEWWVCYFSGHIFLVEPQVSPLLDEFGEPCCPIEIQSVYVDRDNNRYGVVAAWLDIQDEINHRRSKALHLFSSRQTFGNQQAIPDPTRAKEELKKPDGHIELGMGEFGKDFGVLPTGDMAQGQLALLQEAKNEIDQMGANAALTGKESRDLSGRALRSLQDTGQIELGPLFSGHRRWKRRIYRQIWARIKQFWTEERWVRVTDEWDTLRWVGLNARVTVAEALQERAEDEARPPEVRQQAAMLLQHMQQVQDPRLSQVVEIRNPVAELDMDIVIDEVPDAVTLQDEQFRTLADLARTYGPEKVPFEVMLQLSGMRHKRKVMEMLEEVGKPSPEQMQAQQQAMQIQMAGAEAEVAKTQAEAQAKQSDAAKTAAEIQHQQVETAIAAAQPLVPQRVSVSI